VSAYDVADIESRLAAAARSWTDDLRPALCERFGEERGLALFKRYRDAFPAAYSEDFLARTAGTTSTRNSAWPNSLTRPSSPERGPGRKVAALSQA